ncbi:uncharacterized protein LOC135219007 [Macrobrachium nipponense]|uniref:uncharacterized protein LOC135219007 n=1 Tax=Macrobrachium nipponense TaxID=159736 RepID=UPI0030C7FDA3
MCIRNISCSGVTVQYNGAQLTCEFSRDEVLVENLVERSDANTWIFNATTTTTTPAATTTTTSATITTTPSTSSTTTDTTTTTTTPTTTDTTTTNTAPTTTGTTTTTTAPTTTDTTTTTKTSTTTTTTTTTPTTTKAKTCSSYYVMFNGSCYYFHYNNCWNKDWVTAQNDCKTNGSELVKITSQGENDFIKGKVSSSGFWTGLNDRAKEKDFKWSVDNSAVEDNVCSASSTCSDNNGYCYSVLSSHVRSGTVFSEECSGTNCSCCIEEFRVCGNDCTCTAQGGYCYNELSGQDCNDIIDATLCSGAT